MIESIQNIVGQNFSLYVAGTAFVSGVCLLYLVMSRTLKKRASEAEAAHEHS